MHQFEVNAINFSHKLIQISALTNNLGQAKINQTIIKQLWLNNKQLKVISIYVFLFKTLQYKWKTFINKLAYKLALPSPQSLPYLATINKENAFAGTHTINL